MTDREIMQMALDALEYPGPSWLESRQKPAEALRARLAQPEQEPVAWWDDRGDFVDLNVSGHGTPLYTAPPKREWQGLTDEEIEKLYLGSFDEGQFARAIEAKLKEKNA